jgi:peptide/nickel transport system ATP-binding protein
MLFISHDLLSVASLSHRVAILHQGELVEIGPTRQIFGNPSHPYTRSLIGALPANPYR